MIRAVILDLGGVIAPGPTQLQISEAAKACGVGEDAFLRAFWKDRIAYDAGLDPYDYWRGVAASLDKTFLNELIDEMIEREIQFWMRLDDRILGWSRERRLSGHRIGLLSNLPSPLGLRLRGDADFMAYFDHVTLSFEIGIVKPRREIYEHAVRGLGVAPEEALFIDDRPENVEGARAAGLDAYLYTGWAEFTYRDDRLRD